MIITIEGLAGEGKTSLAKDIINGREHIEIAYQDIDSYFSTRNLTEEHEFILVDDVIDMDKAVAIFSKPKIQVNNPCKIPFYVNTPNVILIKFSA